MFPGNRQRQLQSRRLKKRPVETPRAEGRAVEQAKTQGEARLLGISTQSQLTLRAQKLEWAFLWSGIKLVKANQISLHHPGTDVGCPQERCGEGKTLSQSRAMSRKGNRQLSAATVPLITGRESEGLKECENSTSWPPHAVSYLKSRTWESKWIQSQQHSNTTSWGRGPQGFARLLSLVF